MTSPWPTLHGGPGSHEEGAADTCIFHVRLIVSRGFSTKLKDIEKFDLICTCCCFISNSRLRTGTINESYDPAVIQHSVR